MSGSSWLHTSRYRESCDVAVDGFGVDYSGLPADHPERTMPIVTMYVSHKQRVGSGPERHRSVNVTFTPEEAEALGHALIVQAANARTNRDELAANRPVVRQVAS